MNPLSSFIIIMPTESELKLVPTTKYMLAIIMLAIIEPTKMLIITLTIILTGG